MARKDTRTRSSAMGRFITVHKDGEARPGKVKFGSVTISGAKPSPATVKANVERSTQALERATKRLIKPGVVLRAKKGVPQFSMAEGETDVFIRRLDGRTERGRLVNGVFEVID